MERFQLGIDLGTSNTVAMLRRADGRARPLLFDGSPLLPSAVYAESNGTILVGREAQHSGRIDPERFEPNPKRRIDDGIVLLGEHEIPVARLLAAVLGRVKAEADRITGGGISHVVITCPAAWGPQRRGVLTEAAQLSGLGTPELLAEPIAAARYFVDVLGNDLPMGRTLVVYDFGAGTLDVSAVRRTDTGYTVVADRGLNDVGGLDIDAAIVSYLTSHYGDEATWRPVLEPKTTTDRRNRRLLWEDARSAKEILSRSASTLIPLPMLGKDAPLGREQLEQLARPLLDRTVDAVTGMIHHAKLARDEIHGVFLVGGSSRIPLVSTLLHRACGIPPTAIEQPELVVAEGATIAAADSATSAAVAARPIMPPSTAPPSTMPTEAASPPTAQTSAASPTVPVSPATQASSSWAASMVSAPPAPTPESPPTTDTTMTPPPWSGPATTPPAPAFPGPAPRPTTSGPVSAPVAPSPTSPPRPGPAPGPGPVPGPGPTPGPVPGPVSPPPRAPFPPPAPQSRKPLRIPPAVYLIPAVLSLLIIVVYGVVVRSEVRYPHDYARLRINGEPAQNKVVMDFDQPLRLDGTVRTDSAGGDSESCSSTVSLELTYEYLGYRVDTVRTSAEMRDCTWSAEVDPPAWLENVAGGAVRLSVDDGLSTAWEITVYPERSPLSTVVGGGASVAVVCGLAVLLVLGLGVRRRSPGLVLLAIGGATALITAWAALVVSLMRWSGSFASSDLGFFAVCYMVLAIAIGMVRRRWAGTALVAPVLGAGIGVALWLLVVSFTRGEISLFLIPAVVPILFGALAGVAVTKALTPHDAAGS